MNCTNCGSPIPEGSAFCTSCGAPVETSYNNNSFDQNAQYDQFVQNKYSQPEPAAKQEIYDGKTEDLSSQIFTLGIISFIAAFFSPLMPVSITFAIISFIRAKEFKAYTGRLYGKANTGRGLALAAIIIALISVVATIIVVSAVSCASCAAVNSLSSSYNDINNFGGFDFNY